MRSGVPPERLSRMLALVYYLLQEDQGNRLLVEQVQADLGLSREELEADLALINLVNHGGGTYLLYAELEGNEILVAREPFGEQMAEPARLSPVMAKALLLALELVGDLLPLDKRHSLASARDKVEALVRELDVVGTLGAEDLIPPNSETIATLNQALYEKVAVRLEYYTSSRGELTERLVEPYLLFHSGDAWYLEAYCRYAHAQRTFRLDLIRTASLTSESFEPRDDLDLSSCRAGLLALERRHPAWAVVRFPSDYQDVLEEQGLQPEPGEDGAVRVRIPYLDDRWLIREILGYGGEAVLEEPASVRRLVAQSAENMLEVYVRRRCV